MNKKTILGGKSVRNTLSVVILSGFAAGCSDSEIRTYRVAKEENPAVQVAAAAAAQQQQQPSLPHLHWELPAGWKQLPAERMRLASFQVTGDAGRLAQIAIIPLPGVSNIELESINMWREELGLPELTRDQLKTESVKVGDFNGQMVDLVSEKPIQGEKKVRTVGVVGERKGILWFFKMTGDDTLVAAQKPVFTKFLETLELHDAAHGPDSASAGGDQRVSSNTGSVPESASAPKFEAPEHWQPKPPGPMVNAAYEIKGDGGAADVAISKFPGDVGGLAANVNRWRQQLGLQPLSETEARGSAQMVEVDGEQAYLVDLKGVFARTGKEVRMIAAGVPRGGDTWFYKLTGDEAVVEKEKDAFLKLIRGAN